MLVIGQKDTIFVYYVSFDSRKVLRKSHEYPSLSHRVSSDVSNLLTIYLPNGVWMSILDYSKTQDRQNKDLFGIYEEFLNSYNR